MIALPTISKIDQKKKLYVLQAQNDSYQPTAGLGEKDIHFRE